MKTLKIGEHELGKNNPTYIIAELSANHQQRFDLALKSIEAIAKTGANAVKSQVYTPDTITINSKEKHFILEDGSIWDGQTFYKLYQKAYTPWDWIPKMKKLAESLGLDFFASVFDKSSVDFLKKLNVPAYKIASFEIRDLPLIKYAASINKPIILSTGIAEYDEIKEAVETSRSVGNNSIVLLKCTSAYPTPPGDASLSVIPRIATDFNTVVGLSDHTNNHLASSIAVSLGASVIEKHFILDRSLGGPDAEFSLDKDEFTDMVRAIRVTEELLGKPDYKLTDKQKMSRRFGRSLFVVEDIKRGEKFTEKNIRSIRPADGMHPAKIVSILGRKAKMNLKKGTPLSTRMVS